MSVFQTILESIQAKIDSTPGSDFKVNLYHLKGLKKDSKFVWSSDQEIMVPSQSETAIVTLKANIAQWVSEFYVQDESSMFECEITIDVVDHLMNKLKYVLLLNSNS